MAASISAIRAGLKTNIDAVLSANWHAYAYMLSSPSPPAIDIVPDGITFDTAMARGSDDLRFIVRAVVPVVSDIGMQKKLDDLIDPTTPATSMKAAIEADRTLGGIVSSLRVEDVSGYKLYDVQGASPLMGVEWTVLVIP